jgi:hypothetical protein
VTRRMERWLWALAVLFVVLAAVAWQNGAGLVHDGSGAPRRSTGDGSVSPTSAGAAALSALASSIAARDPFRLERRPATVAFGTPFVAPMVSVEPSRRPRLLLSGVFGPPWQAVLEGIPGREGSVIARAGDVFGDLRIRSVRRDTVVVQGADTTWKLTVRRVW